MRDLWDASEGLDEEVASAASGQDRRVGAVLKLLREAMLSGEWESYLEGVSSLARSYARGGAGPSLWSTAMRTFRVELRRRLLAAYAGDGARLAGAIAAMEDLHDMTITAMAEEYVQQREARIRELRALLELSTPVLPLEPGLLVVPVVGTLDSARARQLNERLLGSIRDQRATAVVVDLTGLRAIDSAVARYLLKTAEVCRLMGAQVVISGLSTDNAVAMGRTGIELSTVVTTTDLRHGVAAARDLASRSCARGIPQRHA
jgi:rsbT co-antagonist protein RsbR